MRSWIRFLRESFRKKTANGASSKTDSREKAPAFRNGVSYAHITREFGEGFLFSPESIPFDESGISLLSSGTRREMQERCENARITLFENARFRRIVRLSLSIPTFDFGDRQYDSWHDLFLYQEHTGIIRAVYCTGGYRIAHVEGCRQVYRYPQILEKYFEA